MTLKKKILYIIIAIILGCTIGFVAVSYQNKPIKEKKKNSVSENISELNSNVNVSEIGTSNILDSSVSGTNTNNNENELKTDNNQIVNSDSANTKPNNKNTNSQTNSNDVLSKDSSCAAQDFKEPEKTEVQRTVVSPTNDDLLIIKNKFFEKINSKRKSVGVSSLILQPLIDNAAKIRANEVIDCYSHTRPNGTNFSSLILSAGYGTPSTCTSFVGGVLKTETEYDVGNFAENISSCNHISSWNTQIMPGFTATDDELENIANTLYENFINSPNHYSSIVDSNYKSTGIGISYKYCDANTPYIRFFCVQLFTEL